jgi:hypothetical protein
MTNQFANQIGYSDITPFEIIATSKSGKQITIRAMRAERDTNWTPEFHAGGFVGNCSNQSEQKWVITSDDDAMTIKAHKRADGYFYSAWGKHKIEAQPRRFYDFNF